MCGGDKKYFSVYSQDNVLSINWIWFYLHSLILKVSTNHAYLVFIETLVFPRNFQGKKWNQNSKQNELIWGFRLLELSRMVPPLCNHLKWHNDMTRKICYVIVSTKLWLSLNCTEFGSRVFVEIPKNVLNS